MNLSELSDEKLVVLVQSVFDQNAYSELVRRHQSALEAFLIGYTNDRYMAQDLCQEALIKGYTKIRQFKQDCSFKTWLFSIAYREFLQSQRKLFSFVKLKRILSETRDKKIDEKPEITIDLSKALQALDQNERAAVLLSELCGLSHQEVAIAMNMPLGSVKTYIRRGKGKLLERGNIYNG